MDILSYKLGKNASGGGGGGGEQGYVYPLEKTPKEIIDEYTTGRSVYVAKLLIFNADDEFNDTLSYLSIGSYVECYLSDGSHQTQNTTLNNYKWDISKDIQTPYGKKRFIVIFSYSKNSGIYEFTSSQYMNNLEYCYVYSKTSNYTYCDPSNDMSCYAKCLEIGNENTHLNRITYSYASPVEEIKPFNIGQIELKKFTKVKELDFSNVTGAVSSISGTLSSACSSIKKIILGNGVTSLADPYCYNLEEIVIPKDTNYDIKLQESRSLSPTTLLHIMENIKNNYGSEETKILKFHSAVRNLLQARYVKEENGELVWCESTDTGSILASTYITNKGWTISS